MCALDSAGGRGLGSECSPNPFVPARAQVREIATVLRLASLDLEKSSVGRAGAVSTRMGGVSGSNRRWQGALAVEATGNPRRNVVPA
jgi:hypothetical protein